LNKLVFKNHILNIIVGFIMIAFTIAAYFLKWYQDFLGIIVGGVLLALSVKRFVYSFKKTISKNATLVLVIELVLDFVFCGLLIYYQNNIQLYAGLVLYVRGVSYLIINYITTRKVKLFQYLLNIVYITAGSFLMFTSYDFVSILEILVAVFVLLLGAFFLYVGFDVLAKANKKKKAAKPFIEDKVAPAIPTIAKPVEKKVEPTLVPTKPVEKVEPVEVKPKVEPVVVVKPKVDYSKLTLAELKVVAKEKGLVGYSTLSKAELIEKLNVRK